MEKRILYFLIAFQVLIVGLNHFATADDCMRIGCSDTSGQHFLITLPPVLQHDNPFCEIHIASMQDGFVNMKKYNSTVINEIGNFTLKKGVISYSFRRNSLFQDDQGLHRNAIEVASSVNVRVFVSCEIHPIAAAFLVLPTNCYGCKYVWSSYKVFYSGYNNYLIVTGIQNDTRVAINNFPHSVDLNRTLDDLTSYEMETNSDPNVTLISSDKPVNVVSGCLCAWIPKYDGYCNTMFDSPIPVEYWGKEFIVPFIITKSDYVVRIYTDNAYVPVNLQYSNGFVNVSLAFSSMTELHLKNHSTVIITDRPVNVVLYGNSSRGDSPIGGSFMASVPAINRFSKDYVFSTVFTGNQYYHRIAVTIASSEVNGLILNGRSLSAHANVTRWNVPNPFSDYSVVTVDLPEDNYTLVHSSSDVSFSVLYYGMKRFRGFGYYLGFSFHLTDINQCTSNPCMNGGTCVNISNHIFSCICPGSFTGSSCEHALPTRPLSQGNLTCFGCEDTSSLAFCDTVESCKSNEICFLERFMIREGHVHFRSGCKDKQTCSLHNQTDVVQQATCLDCCDVSFCNSQGCGETGFPPASSRGPICLDCAHVRHPTECDQVRLCAPDELCYAEEVKWGAESLFHLGCKSDHQCAFESSSAVPRAVPVCRNCCHGDFCNQNCTSPDNHQSPIIVG